MTVTQSVLAFAAAAALLTITPGVDTAMVLRTAVGDGPRRAVLAATGFGLGCLAWGATVSLGLGALERGPQAYASLAEIFVWMAVTKAFASARALVASPSSISSPV